MRLLENKGGRVLFLCPAALEGILRSLGTVGKGNVELLVDAKKLPKFDVHAPLMSLPYLLGTRLESIPADVPYLFAEQERVAAWREELDGQCKMQNAKCKMQNGASGNRPGCEELSSTSKDLRPTTSRFNPKSLKVGIAWQGNPKHRGDRYRSVPLALFEPLARVEGVELFSLQKNHGQEQLSQVTFAEAITDLAPRLESFLDTAAVLANLDLLICCDTSLAHLAGALGRPAWVAIACSPDWRWMLDRDDSPWYPSLRLFRQRRPGDWADVFDRIAAALAGF